MRSVIIFLLCLFVSVYSFSQTFSSGALNVPSYVDCGVRVDYTDTSEWVTVSDPKRHAGKGNFHPEWVYSQKRTLENRNFVTSTHAIFTIPSPCQESRDEVIQYRVCKLTGWYQKRIIATGYRYEKKKTEYELLLEKFNLHE